VRNEGINLEIMLKMLKGLVEVPHEVLVVYDFPEDDSIPVIDAMQSQYPNLHGVHNTFGKGVINAIKAGVHHSRGTYVLIFAADEVGPVLAIDDMLALMDQGCDMVSCTRYAHGGRRLGGSLLGSSLSRLANYLFCLLSNSVFSDCTTGIKMFRREVFGQLNLEANPVGWAVAFEMAIKAQCAGFKLGEVPIISIDRLYGGVSTFKPGPWIKEYSRWFRWGVKALHKAGSSVSAPPAVRIPKSCPINEKNDK